MITPAKPVSIETETENDRYGKYICAPLPVGYGTMLGVGMRRVLLSSIMGDAIVSVIIDGVQHEFSTLPGVREDITHVILNLKEVRLKMNGTEPHEISIDAAGECEVTAKDIAGDVEIMNPEQHIATLNGDGVLKMRMRVEHGRGYVPCDKNKRPDDYIGVIPIDSIFSPIIKVNYKVEKNNDETEKLILEVWTDGAVCPRDAVGRAAKIFVDELQPFKHLPKMAAVCASVKVEQEKEDKTAEEENLLSAYAAMTIEEMDFSVRAFNCLKRANINTVGTLIEKTEADLEKVRNLGRKSIEEIRNKLGNLGLSLKSED